MHTTADSTLRDLGRFELLFTPSWQTASNRHLASKAYLKKSQQSGRPEIFNKAGWENIRISLFPKTPRRQNTCQREFAAQR